MLEPRLPLELKVIPRVVDDLVEGGGFGETSLVVLELILCLFPRVALDNMTLEPSAVVPAQLSKPPLKT